MLVQEERKVLEEAKFAAVGYETTTKDGKAVRLTGAAAAAAGTAHASLSYPAPSTPCERPVCSTSCEQLPRSGGFFLHSPWACSS